MRCYLAMTLVLLAAATAQAGEKKLDRTFNVAPGGALTVDADGATVKVSGNDGNQVVVHMLIRGPDKDFAKTTLDATQNGNDVTVRMKRAKDSWLSWGNWNTDEFIEVTVPRSYAITVRTGGGSVELRDTAGSATLHTSGGSITAQSVTGNIELRTSGGSIHAQNIRGDVDAGTSGGEVKLLDVDGKIRGNTSGGSMRCSLVGANRGISATTSGGTIELTLPRSTTGNVEATTSGGQIDSDLPVTSTGRMQDSRLVGTLNGGGAPIYARTSGGSIRLRAAN